MTIQATAAFHQTTELWHPNLEGSRNLEDALRLAAQHGVEIPEFVEFREVDDSIYDSLSNPQSYAYYGMFSYHNQSEIISWHPTRANNKCLLEKDGKIIVKFRKSLLRSDRAIVAIFAHEAFEISKLEESFRSQGGRMTVKKYSDLISYNVANNLHSQAVAYGDELVRRMLGPGAGS